MGITKLQPQNYITNWEPTPEETLQASDWFEVDHSTIRVNHLDPQGGDSLGWMLSQGWIIIYSNHFQDSVEGVITQDYTSYFLRRRTFRSEQALNDLISQVTDAYNEGREVNDQRYDEIVAVYTAMVSNTEDRIIEHETMSSGFETLVGDITSGMSEDYTAYIEDTSEMLEDYGESQIDDIEDAFRAKQTAVKQSLRNRGLYNSTISASISAGIEREKVKALSETNDRITRLKLERKDLHYNQKMALSDKLLAAKDRIFNIKNTGQLTRVDMQTKIVSAMLNFMERREDTYPDLAKITDIASRLGNNSISTVGGP